MKTLSLSTVILLVLAGCASKPVGNSMISGKIKVLSPAGYDITSSCSNNIDNGMYAQQASLGVNRLEPILCSSGHDVYRVKTDNLSVDVPCEDSNISFGSIVITLNGDGSYSVTGGNDNLQK